MKERIIEVKTILTRASGYLRGVVSHSLQPYRGCSLGNALCGVGCYAQHNRFLTKGERWGHFLEVKANAAQRYATEVGRERAWARRVGRPFAIYMSSSTEPFLPHEYRYRISQALLYTMQTHPPDQLILQTHTHRVIDYLPLYIELSKQCDLRVHLSIETDQEHIPLLPSHASTVKRRFSAAVALKDAGIPVVITVAPLLPIASPDHFFSRIAQSADAVVIDHYIGGDGSSTGHRTEKTALPRAIDALNSAALSLSYRDEMVNTARQHMPGRVGVGAPGFAGEYH